MTAYRNLFIGVMLAIRSWLWNIAHNSIAHPLMPFLPKFIWKPLHDWTAKKWGDAISTNLRFQILFDDYGDF